MHIELQDWQQAGYALPCFWSCYVSGITGDSVDSYSCDEWTSGNKDIEDSGAIPFRVQGG